MIPAIIVAERKNKTKPVFNGAIASILLTQLGFAVFGGALVAGLLCSSSSRVQYPAIT